MHGHDVWFACVQAPAEEWKAKATVAAERALSASDGVSRTHSVPMPEDAPASSAPPLGTVPEAPEPHGGESGVPGGDTGWRGAEQEGTAHAGDGPRARSLSLWDRLNSGRLMAGAPTGGTRLVAPSRYRLPSAGLP